MVALVQWLTAFRDALIFALIKKAHVIFHLLISKNGLIPEVRRTIKKCETAKVKVVYECIRLLYLMD